MRALVAAFDWAKTPLGPRDTWPQSLRTVVDLVLSSPLSISILWGDDLIQIYNDGYARVLGPRHPGALGQPVLAVWPETRSVIEPLYTGVRRGETFSFENQRYVLERHGFPEETYFTYGYSPIWDDQGRVGGVLVTGTETTAQVLAIRRVELLRERAEQLAQAQTASDVRRLVNTSGPVPDVPFAALHLVGDQDFPARLGLVAESGEPLELDWPVGGAAPRPALALPLDGPGQGQASGVLVLGLNVQVPLDETYRDFLASSARQVAAALMRAQSLEQTELYRQLEEERAALDAFTAFTEAVGTETDISALARRAAEVLLARYPGGTCVYYEPEGDRWRARVWSDDLRPNLLELLGSGLPSTTPFIAQVLQSGRAVFTDQWNPEQQEVEHTGEYRRSGHIPILLGGDVRGLLGLASREQQHWNERDEALFGAVARGLTLALERAEQTRHLDEEREALNAFARFTEETAETSDVDTLAQRAAEVLHATLNVRSAVYFEQEEGLWKARHVSGALLPQFEHHLRAGVPLSAPSFALPTERREPMFFEPWDAAADGLPDLAMYRAVARYPLFAPDHPVGVLGMASPDAPAWTEREKAVFRAVGDSFRLALERAARMGQVERQRERLADLNAELGNFITRTAHSLEEPARRLGHPLDPGRPHDPQALEGLSPYDPDALRDEVTRLTGVARDLRQLSTLEGHPLTQDLLPLGEVFEDVRGQVSAPPRGRQTDWLIHPLPIVRGDRALLRQALEVLMTFILSETRGARYVTVGSRDVQGEMHVTVEDDGVGLSGEEAATLFDLAVRTDQAVPLLSGGGLMQVRRILARHGGWVWAESRLSGGKVILAFPRDEAVNEFEALFRQDQPGR
ncbi:GAF domain-containing protein [Deinococcus aestuarii]|uniref:GAF domain-containing protein n=1 Tax=Deinococcus aestuarii TaxID=2774531 RepID=UPI001C0D2236|nr:GAF domain-containing protein [Deinococcus aestuarii]